eukprot:CAMPEP_0114236218 /NCGR_PEP_ID=MMETSP0058-20121206/6717_1 /TAXON_ID=36894 /ORGANISM="Pyramimonas parkeae, CCMP726" /LENGTH=146 /DNA_ID=CAMNT_0001348133 /DNA_START=85 /DNA_END=525 /DNA_ORIENTATION=-
MTSGKHGTKFPRILIVAQHKCMTVHLSVFSPIFKCSCQRKWGHTILCQVRIRYEENKVVVRVLRYYCLHSRTCCLETLVACDTELGMRNHGLHNFVSLLPIGRGTPVVDQRNAGRVSVVPCEAEVVFVLETCKALHHQNRQLSNSM